MDHWTMSLYLSFSNGDFLQKESYVLSLCPGWNYIRCKMGFLTVKIFTVCQEVGPGILIKTRQLILFLSTPEWARDRHMPWPWSTNQHCSNDSSYFDNDCNIQGLRSDWRAGGVACSDPISAILLSAVTEAPAWLGMINHLQLFFTLMGSDSELHFCPLSEVEKVCGENGHRLVLFPDGSTKIELPVKNVLPRMREDLASIHPGKVL